MPHSHRNILLITATSAELNAALGGLEQKGSGGHLTAPDSSHQLKGQGKVTSPCGVWREASYDIPFPRTGPLPVCTYQDINLHLLVSGVGPVAAGLSLGSVLGSYANTLPFQGILHMGLAGSYDLQQAPVGSLVLSTEERLAEYGFWPEYDESVPGTTGDLPPGTPGALAFAQCDLGEPVFTTLPLEPKAALGKMGLNWHSDFRAGTGVTVTGVSGTLRRAARMASLTNGLTESMEGFALALGAKAWQLPFVELRAVSNQAGCRPPHTWDVPKAFSALGQGLRTLLDKA